MTSRDRASHVRPRAPSSGRPRPTTRVAAPSARRVRAHRGLEGRRQRLPLPARALLTLSVVILGVTVYLTATGGIGPLVASLGSSFGSAFGKLVATPNASPSAAIATDSPIIAAPDQPYTNQATTTLHITVPVTVVGTSATVRVYVALQGLAMTPVTEVPVGSTTQVSVQVNLTKGQNNFSATIVKDGAESAEAPVVTIVLDQAPPNITISSPKAGVPITGSTLTITGTTKAGSSLLAQNAANGASVSGIAGTDGKFSLTLAIVQGANAITIRATDQAGNQTTTTLNVTQGSGQMTARLTTSSSTISISAGGSLQLRVVVTDSTGAPLAGASATFTLQIYGLPPVQSGPLITDAAGRAVFTAVLSGQGSPGPGLATVLVTDPNDGQTSASRPLLFVK